MKLIDKDALVAEIESKFQKYWKRGEESDTLQDGNAKFWVGVLSCLNEVKTLIDTLEVKEVDLEHEVEFYWKQCDMTWCRDAYSMTHIRSMLSDIAKHFFELGLQVRTDKELVEEVYSHIDAIKETADRMTSGNFMHNRAAIKFSANTIAKVLELMGLKAQKGEEYDRQSTEN